MMTFSYEDLAKYYGVSRTTFKRHLHKLVTSDQFKKTAKGRYFNESDAVKIASLLGFKIRAIENSISGASGVPQKKEYIPPNQINLVDSIKEVEQEKNKFKFK